MLIKVGAGPEAASQTCLSASVASSCGYITDGRGNNCRQSKYMNDGIPKLEAFQEYVVIIILLLCDMISFNFFFFFVNIT